MQLTDASIKDVGLCADCGVAAADAGPLNSSKPDLMRIQNSFVLLGLAASVLAFGTAKLLAQLFLANWEFSSAGHPDIAARGVWLLSWILPQIAAVSVLASVGIVLALTRRTGRAWPARLTPALIGSGIGVALVVVGADPTALALRLFPWQSALGYHVVSGIVAVVLVLVGVFATRTWANACPVVTAAV